MPYALGAGHARHENRLRFRRLRAAARQGAGAGSAGTRCNATSRARRGKGETVGAGLALFVEKSGLGPFDTVRVEAKADGAIEVVTGVASIGQGVETAMAQICADALGVDYNVINVIHGQTDRIERGMGAFASRVTVMCGEATRLAATKLRARALQAAAELMQASPDRLDIVDGVIRGPGPSMTLGELAGLVPGGLRAEDTFESRAHGLPLRRAYRGRAHRCRYRRGHGRALLRRLRRRPGGQSDAGARARSPAASRRAWAARCWKSSVTTRTASRSQ